MRTAPSLDVRGKVLTGQKPAQGEETTSIVNGSHRDGTQAHCPVTERRTGQKPAQGEEAQATGQKPAQGEAEPDKNRHRVRLNRTKTGTG